VGQRSECGRLPATSVGETGASLAKGNWPFLADMQVQRWYGFTSCHAKYSIRSGTPPEKLRGYAGNVEYEKPSQDKTRRPSASA
jgi:hypothetical protein